MINRVKIDKKRVIPIFLLSILISMMLSFSFPYSLLDKGWDLVFADVLLLECLSLPLLILCNLWMFYFDSYAPIKRVVLLHFASLFIAVLFIGFKVPFGVVLAQCLVSIFIYKFVLLNYSKRIITPYTSIWQEQGSMEDKLQQVDITLVDAYLLLINEYNLTHRSLANERLFKLAFFECLIKDYLAIKKEVKQSLGSDVVYNYVVAGRRIRESADQMIFSRMTALAVKKKRIQDRYYLSSVYKHFSSFLAYRKSIQAYTLYDNIKRKDRKIVQSIFKSLVEDSIKAFEILNNVDPSRAINHLMNLAPMILIAVDLDDTDIYDKFIELGRSSKEGRTESLNANEEMILNVIERIHIYLPIVRIKHEDILEIFSIKEEWFKYIIPTSSNQYGDDF